MIRHPIVIAKINIADKTFPHREYHRFALPGCGEPGFYRQVMSFNAFFHGRKQPNWTKKFLYTQRDQQEFDRTQNNMKKYGAHLPNLVIIDHASIWDFYKHVGYDYKTKKWNA